MEQNTHSMSDAEVGTEAEADTEAESPVAEQFHDIEPWEMEVTLNFTPEMYVVGCAPDPKEYRLYDGNNGFELIGRLKLIRNPGVDNKDRVKLVKPNVDEPIVVYSMGLVPTRRTEILDEHLTEIRSELTGVDFSADNPQPSYGDQMDAVAKLKRYYNQQYDGENLSLNVEDLSRPEVQHAIARYKHGAAMTLNQMDTGLNNRHDTDSSPIAVRELLLQFYIDCIDR